MLDAILNMIAPEHASMQLHRLTLTLSTFLLTFVLANTSTAQQRNLRWVTDEPKPSWIWDANGASNGQQIHLRKTFRVTDQVKSARVYTTCDNTMKLWINGSDSGSSPDWPEPIQRDVTNLLKRGDNTISVQAKNAGGIAAFVFKLEIKFDKQPPMHVVSDPSWSMTNETVGRGWFSKPNLASTWTGKLKILKTLGAAPWGVPKVSSAPGSVTDPADVDCPDGFVIELVHTVDKNLEGSWVSLTPAGNGKLIACDQSNKGAFWIEVIESGSGPTANVTPIKVNQPGSQSRLSGAQGLLWAFDSLWFHKNGGNLYRVTDTDGDGTLDQVETIPSKTGGGEHGNHAVVLTPDKEGIFMVGGNHADLAEVTRSRVRGWQEDLLLPRMWDANGHARGRLAPGGWVTRLDPKTQEQELICIGFRNQYDVALNRFGDLFTYDADMEWDLGSPWYRPTRICQVVSGADYGWRSGTGKWKPYFEDSLPPVVEIGPGSPTGVVSGIGTKFPAKYQDAIFALDWTFGTIYAIHMTPNGAGYVGESESFVTGSPLPVTDAAVAEDGNLYFAVGGRGTQSGLYRVRYTGPESTASASSPLPAEAKTARVKREQLEAFHGVSLVGDAAGRAIETAWAELGSSDRVLRNAARVAIESQPVEFWSDRVLSESDLQTSITSAVALARSGNQSHQPALLQKLCELSVEQCSEQQLLGLLRAVGLTCIRLGSPDQSQRETLLSRFDPLLPHESGDVNSELVDLLVYLRSPTVIDKTMQLIANREPASIPNWSELASRNSRYGGTVKRVLDNHPPSREIGYALALRTIKDGWKLPQRRAYFQFLNEAAKKSGGASYPGFLRNIRNEALGNCSDETRVALQEITGEDFDPVPDFEIKPVVGPGRVWEIDEAVAQTSNFRKANFEVGRSLYFATGCGKCHRYAGLGGNIGPDLTSIPNKFDSRYVVEHILDPSKVISDQYQSSTVLTADGRTLTGLVSKADGKVVVYPANVNAEPITLKEADVEAIRPSSVSQMPKGLVDGLNPSELRDLIAYLMSGGDPENRKVYGK